jgi:hypothetical protein
MKKPDERVSGRCAVCKRRFSVSIPFGHKFRTSWGTMDVCELCAEDIYATVMADVAGGMFSLKRDINEIRAAVKGLAKRIPGN